MNYNQAVAIYKSEKTKECLWQQVDALIAEMTLKEKTAMLHGRYLETAANLLIGLVFHGTIFYKPWRGGGCKRLGIPKYYFSDGPRGAVTGKGTCFPTSNVRGATFDDGLEYRVNSAIAKEAIAGGANYFAGICINLVRNPRWGRSQESYGEDTCLLGIMGAAAVKAVQDHGLIACPKHFALNSIENLRFSVNAMADEQALREIYLRHFKKCVDAGALSIMGAYNRVNGEYCCENKRLLKDILRNEWGFDGFVMSDFVWGVHDAEGALKAGLDSEMPFPRHFNYANIKKQIKSGKFSIEDIDRPARNILGVMLRTTPFIHKQPKHVAKCKEHLDLAQEVAEKGMVLIKNNQVLPLARDTKLAVIGPYADRVNVGDRGSSLIVCKDGVTPYAGINKVFSNVTVCMGSNVEKAKAAAAGADVVIVPCGCDYRQEGEFLINAKDPMKQKRRGGLGGDRDSLSLGDADVELLRALKAKGKKVVAVLYTGSVVLTAGIEAYTDAIIHAGYGGIRFGDALANLLSGARNFSGKLTATIAKDERDYPPFLAIGQRPYDIRYGYYSGYSLFDKESKEAQYLFGFGLSYTSFEISGAGVNKTAGGICVSFTLRNTGKADGAEVVQVYAGSCGATDDRPVKQLKGFKRVELAAGQSVRGEIAVSEEDLMFYRTEEKKWALDREYAVYIGNSSRNVTKIGETIKY